jgi:DNA-binding response OmpR family regulator
MVDILLVEDEATLARNTVRFLSRRGYSIALAATLGAARKLCHELRPALVLTDLDLPDGDGLTLAAELRRAAMACKVVLITGRPRADLARAAHEAGADRYLEKPVPFETLSRIIAELHTPLAKGAPDALLLAGAGI